MTIRKIPALSALAGLLACSPAFAAQADQDAPLVRHQIVNTADLDLSSPTGVNVLHRRIAKAVNIVCAAFPDSAGMDQMMEAERSSARCRAQSWVRANQRVAALISRSVQLSSR